MFQPGGFSAGLPIPATCVTAARRASLVSYVPVVHTGVTWLGVEDSFRSISRGWAWYTLLAGDQGISEGDAAYRGQAADSVCS